MPRSSSRSWRSTSTSGEAARAFMTLIKVCPPASARAPSFAARAVSASSTDCGRAYSTSRRSIETRLRAESNNLVKNVRRVAILGGGKIGESLVAGLLSSAWREAGEVVVTGRREERLRELSERHGVGTTLSNAEAIAGAELVVVAVKPQDIDALLDEIGGVLTTEQTLLSVAAAIPTP